MATRGQSLVQLASNPPAAESNSIADKILLLFSVIVTICAALLAPGGIVLIVLLHTIWKDKLEDAIKYFLTGVSIAIILAGLGIYKEWYDAAN